MSNAWNGGNSLNYRGTNATRPPNWWFEQRDPTIYDISPFRVGDLWLTKTSLNVWLLLSLANPGDLGIKGAVAKWVMLSGGFGSLDELVDQNGAIVVPDNGAITIIGLAPISVTKTGASQLTVSISGTVATSYPTNSGTAIPAGGVLEVLGTNGITTSGATNIITVTTDGSILREIDGNSGTAIPSGGIINLIGTAPINVSCSGNTATISFNGSGFAQSFPTSAPVTTPTVIGGTSTPNSSGVLNLQSSHGISVSGGANVGATNDVVFWLNNAINLGDLTGLASGANALNCYTGDINIAAGNLKIPNTNTAWDQGVIEFGGMPFISNYTQGNPNVFIGLSTGNNTLTTANQNFGLGWQCLNGLTTGTNNIAMGQAAGQAIQSGGQNIAIGSGALAELTTGIENTAVGHQAAQHLLTGSYNMCFGVLAGSSLTGAESHNILIGAGGVVGESGAIRIGDPADQTTAYISGVYGVTTTSGTTSTVLISNTGQLGTISSSERYKTDIKPMGSKSSIINHLHPVTFSWREHPNHGTQFGLIAEEVYKVMPQLVNLDKNGIPDNVKYHDLPVLLLNELQKLSKRVDELEKLMML